MSKGASLKNCERLMKEGKKFDPAYAVKARATAVRQKIRSDRWVAVVKYIDENTKEE